MPVWAHDITALLQAFETRATTPSLVVTALQARIERLDPHLNAYCALSRDLHDAARAATDRWARGTPVGPLDGVPVIVKDNLVAAGLSAAWGNPALAQRICAHDEAPVARLRAAGALIIGKGNTPEFSLEGFTDNRTFGTTCNPFDTDLTPGGSSGGVVAAIAAGLAFAGIGTDGGGSIRRPVGYTGLIGLKPGIGHVARAGGLAQILLDFEVVGPITRSLRDARLLDSILSDMALRPPAVCAPARILAVPILDNAPCDPVILRAFNATVTTLRDQGHDVVIGQLPYDLTKMNTGWGRVGEIGLASYFGRDPEVAQTAAPKYREMAARGAQASATELYAVLDAVYALRNASRQLWGHDAILMPASAANPWPAGESHPPRIAGQDVGPRGHAVYTGWVNAAGLPAIGFPATVPEGLPIGMQLVGPMQSEIWLMDLIAPILAPFRWPALATAPE
ncbi:MAG: amidase [Roseovarius sp.]|nr:amidase [Roseovarius sp.]